jgi:antitoxin (DNA-binding transcriptional repressor) of toxin-antitoxin stability system
MTIVTIEEAKADLETLIEQLQPGEQILSTDQGEPLDQVKKAEQATGRQFDLSVQRQCE